MSPSQKQSQGGRGSAPLHQPKAWVRITIIVVVILLALSSVLFLVFDSGDDSSDVTAGGSDSSSSSTLPQTSDPASVADQPCVAMAGQPPTGAPLVPVQVGPPPTELVTQDLEVGTGAEVAPGATVTVDYIGVSCSTGVIFDASYGTGQTATFGLDEVIPGWGEGIPGMKVGGLRLLGIPPDLAYGDRGSPPDIAPGETLWFVVKVHSAE